MRQLGDVLLTLAQRGQGDGHHVQTIVEILAEMAQPDLLLQVTVGGGDDADIHPQGLIAADPLHLPLLEDTQQLGLERGAAFTNLIEEQGAAIRQLKTSFTLTHRPGKGAFLMAEQFAFQQGVRQRRAVKFDEGGASPWRMVMDGVGDQLFPGAAFAAYQHGGVPARDLTDHLHDLAHRRALADHIVKAHAARRRAGRRPFHLRRLAARQGG